MHEAKNVQPKLMHVYKLQKLFTSLGGCYHAESLSGYEYMNAGMENFRHKNQFCCSVSCLVSINLINVFRSDCTILDVFLRLIFSVADSGEGPPYF